MKTSWGFGVSTLGQPRGTSSGIATSIFGGLKFRFGPVDRADGNSRPGEGRETVAERDLTAREDRFIGLCLAVVAIIIVFIFIVTTS
jgi:hypothetical protein